MRKLLLIIIIVSLQSFKHAYSQTPSTCFEIESILVDACGTPEWENEMVRFTVGPAALNVNDITVSWPNNPFRGMCQNATTAAAVSALNATIQGCGYLKEPIGGVLPAGAKVLFFTDVNVSTTANSFTNLNDTLYAIFQCSGNSSGHFVNYSSTTGIRTLTISFSNPASCSDQVTYDRALLVNQSGNPGGSSSALDGGRVDFLWNGTPSYENDGCQAPFIPLSASAGNNLSICDGSSATLSGSVSGSYTSLFWTGGTGTLSAPSNDTTSYTPAPGETGNLTLTMSVVSSCNDTISSSMTLTINTPPVASIGLSANDTICSGSSVTLTGNGGSSYLWNTGSTLPSIQVTTTGTYTVTAQNNCGNATSLQFIQVMPLPATAITASGPTTFCSGSNVTLTASGAETYLWSDGTIGTSITVTQAGTYTVTGNTSYCGSSVASETIIIETEPTVQIAASGPTSICAGTQLTLTASGANSYLWSDGSTTNSITVSQSGNYSVTGTNNCGSNTSSVTVSATPLPVASVTGDLVLCNGESSVLTASGGDTYTWSTGETTSSIIISAAAPIYAVAFNSCGNDTAFVTAVSSNISSSFSADTTSGFAPLSVSFTNASVNADTYSWSFGDTQTSTEINPSHTFSDGGTYLVLLTSTNSAGCLDTSSLIIQVEDPKSLLVMPNVFTPNNDNSNDLFLADHSAITEFQCEIFDRWGLRIVSLTDINKGWDGRTEAGKPASSGTYYYIVKAKGLDEIDYNLHGTFMLFR